MGCASSKILRRSGSIQELKRRLHSGSNGLRELQVPEDGRDRQFLALVYSASTVAKTTKSVPPHEESDRKSTAALQPMDVKLVDANSPVVLSEVETISAWELLDGLEEEKEAGNETATSENAVEDYDAMAAANKQKREMKHVVEISKRHEVEASEESECSVNSPQTKCSCNEDKNSTIFAKASRRRSMAKDLSALKIPPVDLPRSGSLRDWLLGGGQVMSPGSYVTPKFGNFAEEKPVGVDRAVFDPEMFAQFERAMAGMTMDEELILKHISENLEEGHEEEDAKSWCKHRA